MTTRFAALFFTIFLSVFGCTRSDKAGQKFLLPWPDEHGQESLQVVTIETLNSPYELSGPAAKVYLQSGFSNSGYLGDPVHPQMTVVDGIFIPINALSSLGLVLYAHMERIQKLDVELGFHTGLHWPRQVGYQILMQGAESSALEFNNALYFWDWDAIAFMPTTNGKTSLAINPGVIAHEHYHAHFYHRVQASLPQLSHKTALDIFNEEVVLRGWNEGLADYYGFIYSKNPEFLEMSFGHSDGQRRKLNVKRGYPVRTAATLYKSFEKQFQNQEPYTGFAYFIGTDIARTLYQLVEVAEADAPISTHKRMMQFVTQRLDQIPNWYRRFSSGKQLEPAGLLKMMFLDVGGPVLTPAQCEFLQTAAPSYFQEEDFKETKCLTL